MPAQSGTGQVTVTTTSTTLSTSPTSPTSQGTPVYLTATVRPATATGTVQFKDGTTNLGPPVTVANGTASGTTSSLTARSHQLTAGFTPTDPATHGPSTSPPVTYVVTGGGPSETATRTTLSTSPTSPTSQGTPVYLTATVRPATATGTVQFKDGTTNLGPPVTVANGTASGTTSSLTARSHQLTAGFTPTDPATHGPSTSPPVTYVVTPVSEPGPR